MEKTSGYSKRRSKLTQQKNWFFLTLTEARNYFQNTQTEMEPVRNIQSLKMR